MVDLNIYKVERVWNDGYIISNIIINDPVVGAYCKMIMHITGTFVTHLWIAFITFLEINHCYLNVEQTILKLGTITGKLNEMCYQSSSEAIFSILFTMVCCDIRIDSWAAFLLITVCDAINQMYTYTVYMKCITPWLNRCPICGKFSLGKLAIPKKESIFMSLPSFSWCYTLL